MVNCIAMTAVMRSTVSDLTQNMCLQTVCYKLPNNNIVQIDFYLDELFFIFSLWLLNPMPQQDKWLNPILYKILNIANNAI